MPDRTPCPAYLDLVRPDGSRDAAAFAVLLRHRIAAEIDLRLCAAARLHPPRELSLGDIRAWRTLTARRLDPALVPDDERERVARQEREALEAWVREMQRGGRLQREAMERAAAEVADHDADAREAGALLQAAE
jgi:hypothetical protein